MAGSQNGSMFGNRGGAGSKFSLMDSSTQYNDSSEKYIDASREEKVDYSSLLDLDTLFDQNEWFNQFNSKAEPNHGLMRKNEEKQLSHLKGSHSNSQSKFLGSNDMGNLRRQWDDVKQDSNESENDNNSKHGSIKNIRQQRRLSGIGLVWSVDYSQIMQGSFTLKDHPFLVQNNSGLFIASHYEDESESQFYKGRSRMSLTDIQSVDILALSMVDENAIGKENSKEILKYADVLVRCGLTINVIQIALTQIGTNLPKILEWLCDADAFVTGVSAQARAVFDTINGEWQRENGQFREFVRRFRQLTNYPSYDYYRLGIFFFGLNICAIYAMDPSWVLKLANKVMNSKSDSFEDIVRLFEEASVLNGKLSKDETDKNSNGQSRSNAAATSSQHAFANTISLDDFDIDDDIPDSNDLQTGSSMETNEPNERDLQESKQTVINMAQMSYQVYYRLTKLLWQSNPIFCYYKEKFARESAMGSKNNNNNNNNNNNSYY